MNFCMKNQNKVPITQMNRQDPIMYQEQTLTLHKNYLFPIIVSHAGTVRDV